MSGFSIRDVRRRRGLVFVARTMFVGTMAVATSVCSGAGGAGQAANAPIRVEMSQLFVTVENKAGAPLVNVTVAVVSTGNQAFTKFISRMENGEKRDISLGEFSGRDGTTFNLRVVTPKTVKVTAEDVSSNKHDVEVPWR